MEINIKYVDFTGPFNNIYNDLVSKVSSPSNKHVQITPLGL